MKGGAGSASWHYGVGNLRAVATPKFRKFNDIKASREKIGAKDAKDLTGEQIYARLTQDQGSQQAASEYLNSIGVRGIRYLDQGSRSEGKGTSNFIPFQPEDYRIQELL
jgi:hypothetical protein